MKLIHLLPSAWLAMRRYRKGATTKAAILLAGCLVAGPSNAIGGGVPPETFDHIISDGATAFTINFRRHSNRGPNFSFQVVDALGDLIPTQADTHRTYIGKVVGAPGAIASGLRRSDGVILARIIFEDGTEWTSLCDGCNAAVRTQNGPLILRWPQDLEPIFGTQLPEPGYETWPGGAGSHIFAAETGVDAPEAYVTEAGGTPERALEMIEYSINSANLVYLRDAGIKHEIGRVIIRDSANDPYAGKSNFENLAIIKNEWEIVLPPGTHDLALVPRAGMGGAGRAYLDSIGTPRAYSSNDTGIGTPGDFSVVWRHECGHIWTLDHYDGGSDDPNLRPEGATINSGNDLGRMSGAEQRRVVTARETFRELLNNRGTYDGFPIPPRASMDAFEVAHGAGQLLDVLFNDHDANGEALTLIGVDPVSAENATLTISGGKVLYTPPAGGNPPLDSFQYRIRDAGGCEALGNVVVRPCAVGLEFYRPDVTIGLKSSARKGDGVYSHRGAGQRIVKVSRRRRPVTAFFRVENDGCGEDEIRVKGTRRSKHFKVLYLRLSPSRKNVTGRLEVAAYTAGLLPGQFDSFLIKVTPTRKGRKRKGNFLIDARSKGGTLERAVFQVKRR